MKVLNFQHLDVNNLVYADPVKGNGCYESAVNYLMINEQSKSTTSPTTDKTDKTDKKQDVLLSPSPTIDLEIQNNLFLLETPKIKKHSGICGNDLSTGGLFIDVYLDPKDAFYKFLLAVDHRNINASHLNSIKWFSRPKRILSKEIPVDVIEDYYHSPIKVDREGQYFLRLRVENKCEAYNQAKSLIDLKSVKKNDFIKCIIQLDNLWMARKTIGCQWVLRQIKVYSHEDAIINRKKIIGYALNNSDDEESSDQERFMINKDFLDN